jgi:hypothetical protein
MPHAEAVSRATSTSGPDVPGATPGVERGCGTREEGGVYLEVGFSQEGVPMKYFWADPPVAHEVDKEIGQALVRREDTFHVIDWIGASGYPYPTDILEEARSYGLSRRISHNFPFERLTEESRIILVHGRAVTSDPAQAWHAEEEIFDHTEASRIFSTCLHMERTGHDDHLSAPAVPCNRFWYMDAEANGEANASPGTRSIASTEYPVVDADTDLDMESGIIASFPISRFATIEARDGSHDKRDQMLSEATEIPNVVTEA